MAIKGEKRGAKIFRWCVHIGALAVAVIVTLYAFVFVQPCDIDRQYLYCRTHPAHLDDIIGFILFYAGCVGLSGIWFLVTGDLDDDPGRTIFWISGLSAMAGMLIVWI